MSDIKDFEHAELDLPTGKIAYLERGEGSSLVWLHHSWGNPGALDIHHELAKEFRVLIPDMPGWGGSERPLWARTVRDIAMLINHFSSHLVEDKVTLVGLGFGGYVAAEMATMNSEALRSLVLVGSVGLQPRNDDEIMDQMMYSHRQYIEESFKDRENYVQFFGEEPAQEMRELWDHSREMTARVSWKPYMFNRRLGELLKNVSTPAVIVQGEHDKVVPMDVANQFNEALSQSRLEVVPEAGHLVEIEAPNALQAIISSASA